MKKTTTSILGITLAGVLALTDTTARADSFGSGGNAFVVPFVPIGNAGNANDSTGYGAVSYDYNIAVTDVSQTMLTDVESLSGLNLGGGAWTGNQPAAYVTWYQAAAFVNWLNTSKGYTAAYNLTYTGSTPTGISLWTGANVWTLGGTNYFRNANAHYFLPSENEWYKAAFYDPTVNTGTGGYWTFATGSNTAPTPVASGTAPGTVVYDQTGQPAAVDQSGGLSPYGTQGETGNVYQWMETDYSDPTNSSDGFRSNRGGDWNNSFVNAIHRLSNAPASSDNNVGLRVASVPEPSSMLLMIGSCLMFLARRRRARSL